MSDHDGDEPTQVTEKGLEIPVPKRDDVLRVLRKAAQPRESERDEQNNDDE